MRLAWAFFCRDARIALSYRISFAVQMINNLLIIGLFYFIGKVIGPAPLPTLKEYGGNFLAYLMIGIALTDCVGISLFSFATQIREAQMSGTFEATLLSPVRLPVILAFSSLWNYFLSAVRFICYLIAGGIAYGVSLRQGNFTGAVVVFLLTVLCFMGVGILWAGVIMVVKRGESFIALGGMIVLLCGGVLFPPSMLPHWMQSVATVIPLTYALDGMRHALLQGWTLAQLNPVILRLSLFAAILLTSGFGGFAWSVKLAKQSGSLSQY
jgi:ABC-2 type transport system permease protein